MPRRVVGGLIQAAAPITDPSAPIDKVRQAAIDAHIPLIEEAGRRGVQILGPRGDLQRSVFLSVAGRALVRHCRVCTRADHRAHGAVRQEIPDGHGGAGLRARAGRRVLQHRGCVRFRRHLPRKVPQEPHPSHVRFLGEVLLQTRQPRLPGFQDALRDDRRLHLLRPALPGGRAASRTSRRRDRVQSVGHGCRALTILVEARTAGACRRQRVFHGL